MTTTTERQADYYDHIEYHEGHKTYRGFNYHLDFPNEWILHEKEDYISKN